MPVEILNATITLFGTQFFHKPEDPSGIGEPEVVEHDDTTDRRPRPDPVEGVSGRLINIDVDVAKSESVSLDPWASLLGKDAFEDDDVLEIQFGGEIRDHLRTGVGVLAPSVSIIVSPRLHDALESVAEVHACEQAELAGAGGQQTSTASTPGAHLQDVAAKVGNLAHEMP
jgi:hypothetical protein